MTFSDMVGMTLTAINVNPYEIVMRTACGRAFKLYHEQDCCEDVSVEDVSGDLNDLLHSPILVAEESTSEFPNVEQEACYILDGHRDEDTSQTWTFYKLATVKGWVDIRWYGTSNGYYSESVDFTEVPYDYEGQIE